MRSRYQQFSYQNRTCPHQQKNRTWNFRWHFRGFRQRLNWIYSKSPTQLPCFTICLQCSTIYILSNRRVTYSLGKSVIIRLLLKGFAQGGRLSPTLWNLVADPLLKKVNITLEEFLQALADDLASIIDGDNILDIRERAQTVLDTIEQWCTEAGLTINTSKSAIVIFTHRHNVKLDKPLLYCGTPQHHFPTTPLSNILACILTLNLRGQVTSKPNYWQPTFNRLK